MESALENLAGNGKSIPIIYLLKNYRFLEEKLHFNPLGSLAFTWKIPAFLNEFLIFVSMNSYGSAEGLRVSEETLHVSGSHREGTA